MKGGKLLLTSLLKPHNNRYLRGFLSAAPSSLTSFHQRSFSNKNTPRALENQQIIEENKAN
jgi:hypothetical protein